jgi:hypothetical protein
VTRSVGAAAEATAPAATAGNGRTIWRVIAYTYRRPEPAAAMVAKITARHPGARAEVFSPRGKRDVYLVSLGGGLDHAAAVKMLGKVRTMGLPADSFVQNYSE